MRLDVTDEASVEAAFTEIEGTLGPVDVLVLNAGIFVIEPLAETTLASWRRTMHVNLDGAFLCARRALPGMQERGYGRVVTHRLLRRRDRRHAQRRRLRRVEGRA